MNTTTTRSRSTVWIVALVALAVLGVAAIAFATTRKSSSTTKVDTGSNVGIGPTATNTSGATVTVSTEPGQSVFPISIQGTPLEGLPSKGSDPALGKQLPEISGTSLLTGQPLSIGQDGRPKLILFVAHWCPHCQREVPLVLGWLNANAPKGFDVYAISTGVDKAKGNYPPLAWLTKEKWSVPTLADSEKSDAAQAAGLTGYPFFVAVDKKGNVVARASGELTVDALNVLVGRITG